MVNPFRAEQKNQVLEIAYNQQSTEVPARIEQWIFL